MIRVLLVEDDPSFAETCIARLIRHHLDVRHCTNAEVARRLLDHEEFDLAIIDLLLPPQYAIEGLSLLRFIRQAHPMVQSLLMTQKETGTVELVAEAMKIGAQYFFDKHSEVFLDSLITRIEELMRAAKQKIFISHGHNELLKLKLKDFISSKLKLTPIVLSEQPSQGLTIVEKLERVSETCCFAIVLMTKDDQVKDGGLRARQNVVHEIGFFQGKYGRKNVVLLAERGVESFSNISGIIRLEFEPDHFEEVFEPLRIEIAEAFAQFEESI
jgi:predicted nucleotide-binding protein